MCLKLLIMYLIHRKCINLLISINERHTILFRKDSFKFSCFYPNYKLFLYQNYGLLKTEVSMHEKQYFLFPDVLKGWFFQKYCAGICSFLYYHERWYFFFSKIWSYLFDGKGKIIFLKKYMEIWFFLQMFWKDGPSKKIAPKYVVFCNI